MEYLTALILGLVGSLHCAGMCGPLALALPHPGTGAKGFVASRIAYNLGRIITYSVLGIVFGAIGHTLVIAGLQRWTSIGLGLILIMAILFSRRLGLLNFVTNVVQSLKRRMSSLMQRRSFSTLAMLGLFNGLLPCGLVYVAATASVATGSSFRAAWFMFVFGLGTFPMMLTLSLSTKLLPPGFRIKYRRAIPIAALLLASLLIVRGMNLGIPYLSPNLERPAACCKSH